MSIDITSQIENFKNVKNKWISTVTTQPDPNNLFELNIGINDISLVFDEVIRLLNLVNNSINPVEWYSLESRLDDVITSVTSNPLNAIGSLAVTPHDKKVYSQKKCKQYVVRYRI